MIVGGPIWTVGCRRHAVVLALLGSLSGCGAIYTAVAGRELDVQTRMSSSIFLDPTSSPRRRVWIEVRNTSDKPGLDLRPAVRRLAAERGLEVVDDPRRADVLLQAAVLQAGRSARTAAQSALQGGFGSMVAGAAVGGAGGYGAGRLAGDETTYGIGGALAGAAAGGIADALVQTVDYTVITDIQLAQRAPLGTIVQRSESIGLEQGTGGFEQQSFSDTSAWRRYRSRLVSSAERVGLDWEDAEPALLDGMSRAVVGLL